MPKKSGKSGLAAKLNNVNKLAKDYRNNPVDYGNIYGRLPGGIKGGIAQLTRCHFKEYASGPNKGELFFWAGATVFEPPEHIGLGTSIMMPACETVNSSGEVTSMETNVENITNEMKKLGVEDTGEELEKTAEILAGAGIFLKFSTTTKKPTKKYPNPEGCWENWYGSKGLEDYEPDIENGVTDKTETSTDEKVPHGGVGDELDMLADSADAGDDESISKLADIAREAGVDDNFIENAENWNLVADAIRKAREKGSNSSEETPKTSSNVDLVAIGRKADNEDEEALDAITKAGEEAGVEDTFSLYEDYAKAIVAAGGESGEAEEKVTPQKGEIYFHKPPRARSFVECEVTAVYAGKETVNLKNLDDNTTRYKQVPWDKLSTEEK